MAWSHAEKLSTHGTRGPLARRRRPARRRDIVARGHRPGAPRSNARTCPLPAERPTHRHRGHLTAIHAAGIPEPCRGRRHPASAAARTGPARATALSAAALAPDVQARPRLSLRGITRAYPGVVANDRIDLDVLPGEIHAVLGENGAGKSTLMKIIYGIVKPDAGTMQWEGEAVRIASPAQARRLGLAMVFQHFSLFETLTVAENISLALDAAEAGPGLPAKIRDVSRRYGLTLDPARLVHAMSIGERQRVEIVRCLLQAPRVLIMDEPTSVLTPQAVLRLFDTLRQLADEGCSILYISHKLDEIRALCHRATVLRAGRVTGECDPRRETTATLARMMIGAELPHPRHRPPVAGAPALVIDGLDLRSDDPFGTTLRSISLTVCAGEIVGIAGVSGNGQRELLTALSGERRVARRDAIVLCGTAAGRLGAAQRRSLGLAFVPEERLGRGAVPEMSLAENALLTARHRGLVWHGLIRADAARSRAAEIIASWSVKAAGPGAAARSLSGGNLQKFIVGREILQGPRVLIAAQPTWGVDVGASAQIRQALIDLRDAGVAVLVVSEELEELIEICDRLAVIAQGQLSPARPVVETNAEELGLLMAGSAAMPEPTAARGRA
ncbi:MAG: ABC transporter ATP-binding protein [Betaproteobacteria bacterium]|nr:ABC transporter ATP-binding protein [Betaproteobacteria bacterium]